MSDHARTIRNVVKSFESNFADIPGQYQDQKSALMALRVVSNELELDEAKEAPPRNSEWGDTKCRKCARRGYRIDGFTDPVTGLCVICAEDLKKLFADKEPSLCPDCGGVMSAPNTTCPHPPPQRDPYTYLCPHCNKMSAPGTPCPKSPYYHNRRSIDPINPSHYQGDYVMRIIEDFSLDFLDGQVVKYVLRSGKKDLSPAIDDYKKALWYLTRKIKNLENE